VRLSLFGFGLSELGFVNMNPIPLKIAYIGGGSREWARKLMIDLARLIEANEG